MSQTKVIKTIGGGDITMKELAGAKVHSVKTGICDYRARDEMECLRQAKRLLSFLPSNNLEEPPVVDTGDDPNRRLEGLEDIVPVNPELP